MKKATYLSLLLLLVINCNQVKEPKDLVGKPIPEFTGITLSGKIIDKNYFKGKVTLLNFMTIGCPPCMAEITVLNNFHKKYKKAQFDILCIVPQTEQQMRSFNSSDTLYGWIREYFKADSIQYEVMPECSRLNSKHTPNELGPECDEVSKLFKIDGYPQSFIIDRKGILRIHHDGFAAPSDTSTYNKLKNEMEQEINILLSE